MLKIKSENLGDFYKKLPRKKEGRRGREKGTEKKVLRDREIVTSPRDLTSTYDYSLPLSLTSKSNNLPPSRGSYGERFVGNGNGNESRAVLKKGGE